MRGEKGSTASSNTAFAMERGRWNWNGPALPISQRLMGAGREALPALGQKSLERGQPFPAPCIGINHC